MRWRRALVAVATAAATVPSTASGGTLGGTVWSDRDGDGLRERGEPGVRAIPVEIQRRQGRAFRTVARRVTSRTGRWTYTIARAGTYRARLTPPALTRLTPRDRDRRDRLDSDVRLAAGKALTPARRLTRRGRSARFDMGLVPPSPPQAAVVPSVTLPPVPPGTEPPGPAPLGPAPPAPVPPVPQVGDRVWNDLDGDGVQGLGEPGVAGVTVQTWNTSATRRLDATTTDADGRWALPAEGEVRVRVVLPDGAAYAPRDLGGDDAQDSDIWASSTAAGFSSPVAGAIGRTDVDAGIGFPGVVTIGDRVWNDADADGIQDAGETDTTDLGGRAAEVWNEGFTQRIDETTVGGSGAYTLQVPIGLPHRVRIGLRDGEAPSPAGAGGGAVDSDFVLAAPFAVTPVRTSNTATANLDLGIAPMVVIGDRVWQDVDADGRQDPGEPGMGGVIVQLWNSTKTNLIDQTTTMANGSYRFVEPRAGLYRVRVLTPTGFTLTSKDTVNDLEDSDVNVGGPDNGFTDIIDPTPTTLTWPVWDAGFVEN